MSTHSTWTQSESRLTLGSLGNDSHCYAREIGYQTPARNCVVCRVSFTASLGEKFSELDAEFQARERSLDARTPSGTSAAEERMLRYEREVQARAQQQIKLEVARFRELEAQQIRTQEFDKYRKQLSQLVRDVRSRTHSLFHSSFY